MSAWMRLVTVLGLAAVTSGCEVGLVAGAVAMKRNAGGGSGGGGGSAADGSYRIYTADLADDAAAAAQREALIVAAGQPDPAVWTLSGSGVASAGFVPVSGACNSVLLVSSAPYHVDAVDVPVATIFHYGVTSAEAALVADGVSAELAPPEGFAFLLWRFTTSLPAFRVDAWRDQQASGDVAGVHSWNAAGSQWPGGAAIAADGTLYFTIADGAESYSIRIVTLDAAGGFEAFEVENWVSAGAGYHTVACGPSGEVYAAATNNGNNILVRKYSAEMVAQWSKTFGSASTVDVVESNGLTVDPSGNVIVAGSTGQGLGSYNHWIAKLVPETGATVWTQSLPQPGDLADTYWYGVTTDADGGIYSTGTLSSLASGFVEVLSRKTAADGTAVWSDQIGDNLAPQDIGRSVAVDALGNVVVGGTFGTGNEGKNMVLVKYSAAGLIQWLVTFDREGLDDEILDVAVDADGSIYVAGYSTSAATGEDLCVHKYTTDGAEVWTRRCDGGAGSDRGVSLVLDASTVSVVGYRTLPGGETDVHVRRYVK